MKTAYILYENNLILSFVIEIAYTLALIRQVLN